MSDERFVRDRSGRFAGSIGLGKKRVPTAATPPGYTPVPVSPETSHGSLRDAFARYEHLSGATHHWVGEQR